MLNEEELTDQKSKEFTQPFSKLIKEPVKQKIEELVSFQKRMFKYSDYVFAFWDDHHIFCPTIMHQKEPSEISRSNSK